MKPIPFILAAHLFLFSSCKQDEQAPTSNQVDTPQAVAVNKNEWKQVGRFYRGLAAVKRGGKYGFINKKREIVIAIEWDGVCDFSENQDYTLVCKNKRWGALRVDGSVMIKPEWETYKNKVLLQFSSGLATVTKNNKFGAVDKTGEVKIELKWDGMSRFDDGVATVCKNNKWGLIDSNGKLLTNLEYEELGSSHRMADDPGFAHGVISAVKVGERKYGLINRKGDIISPFKWDDIRIGNRTKNPKTTATVRLDKKEGIIDSQGKLSVPLEWDNIGYFKLGLVRVKKDGLYGIINEAGEVVIPAKWKSVDIFNENKVLVKGKGQSVYLDNKGQKIEK